MAVEKPDRESASAGRVAAIGMRGCLVNDAMLSADRDQISWILRIRRRRLEIFGTGLFSDPAWDLMLLLYQARIAGLETRLAELGVHEPYSTISRWADVLAKRGWVSLEWGPADGEPTMSLTAEGLSKMTNLLQGLRH